MIRSIFLTLCIALFCIGYYGPEGLCNTEKAGSKPTPRLSVPDSYHSFGQIYRGEKVQHRFLLENVGTAELEIKKVRPSCGCTAAEPSQRVIPPGGEAYVEATFNSQNFVGRVTKTVMVDTNDPSEPTHTLILEAVVLEEIVAEPSRLMLGQIKQGEGRNLKVEIKSPTGLRDLKVSQAQSSSKALKVTSIERQPDGVYSLNLEVPKDSPAGRFGGDLVVHTSSQRQPIITIPFFGEVISDVSVFPLQLSFGSIKKGTEAVRQVLITLHSQEVSLARVEVEPEVFSVQKDFQQAGSYRMNVALSKEAPAGSLEGRLKVHTTSKSQPLITIPIYATIKE
jgi:hypothetical protein